MVKVYVIGVGMTKVRLRTSADASHKPHLFYLLAHLTIFHVFVHFLVRKTRIER